MTSFIARLAILTTAISTAACTVLPRPEPPRVMDLAVAPSQTTYDQALPFTVRVDTPLASAPIDSSIILLKPTPYEFQAFRQARWRDSTAVLIRDHLARHLRNSHGFRNIVIDTSPANTNITLLTELSAFYISVIRANKPEAILELHAELTENRSGESLCIRNWSIREPSEDTDLDSAVEAFSRAGNTLAEELTHWARSCVNKAPSTAP
ncbi:ABC-type transport auxiliary lipoprotein family protein [Marinobacter sp.]|uniref:ABC-type transport auxiliary lipoprotein family protein n=1 Tax=Marinobacter sp. TaxID=50741 RepID=UPI003563E973